MTNAPNSEPLRRALCRRCQRAQAACICSWIRGIDNRVELLILQHPLEARQTKGSAMLLSLSLSRCCIEIGEQFSADEFGSLDGTALLYPAADDKAASPAPASIQRLILLDATWRKSRRILHLNPWLLELPRLALLDPPASRYSRLRQAHQSHQLSTLEAGVLALQQLETQPERYTPLLEAFDGFVKQQSAHIYNPAP